MEAQRSSSGAPPGHWTSETRTVRDDIAAWEFLAFEPCGVDIVVLDQRITEKSDTRVLAHMRATLARNHFRRFPP